MAYQTHAGVAFEAMDWHGAYEAEWERASVAAVERRSMQVLAVLDGTVVHETDGDWAAGYGATHAVAKM
jgi:hypothetical protein